VSRKKLETCSYSFVLFRANRRLASRVIHFHTSIKTNINVDQCSAGFLTGHGKIKELYPNGGKHYRNNSQSTSTVPRASSVPTLHGTRHKGQVTASDPTAMFQTFLLLNLYRQFHTFYFVTINRSGSFSAASKSLLLCSSESSVFPIAAQKSKH
jgi:hypothetical protein